MTGKNNKSLRVMVLVELLLASFKFIQNGIFSLQKMILLRFTASSYGMCLAIL